jgi:DUF1365 family protein
LLQERGCAGLEDAWMMTMPSLLGFKGINSLTVYFCYNAEGELFVTVLEVCSFVPLVIRFAHSDRCILLLERTTFTA